MRKTAMVLVMAAVLALAACGGKPKVRPDGSSGDAVGSSTNGASSSGLEASAGSVGANGSGASGPPGQLGSQRIIYFEFDSSDIRSEFVDVIAAHGRYLAGNASIRVRLEGHSDERGTREYNIGLAERRAQAVKRALMLQVSALFLAGKEWLWPVIAAFGAAFASVVWSYFRTAAPRSLRLSCAALKVLGITALLACLLEPMWSDQRVKPGANILAIVADNSLSMTLRDRDATESRGDAVVG